MSSNPYPFPELLILVQQQINYNSAVLSSYGETAPKALSLYQGILKRMYRKAQVCWGNVAITPQQEALLQETSEQLWVTKTPKSRLTFASSADFESMLWDLCAKSMQLSSDTSRLFAKWAERGNALRKRYEFAEIVADLGNAWTVDQFLEKLEGHIQQRIGNSRKVKKLLEATFGHAKVFQFDRQATLNSLAVVFVPTESAWHIQGQLIMPEASEAYFEVVSLLRYMLLYQGSRRSQAEQVQSISESGMVYGRNSPERHAWKAWQVSFPVARFEGLRRTLVEKAIPAKETLMGARKAAVDTLNLSIETQPQHAALEKEEVALKTRLAVIQQEKLAIEQGLLRSMNEYLNTVKATAPNHLGIRVLDTARSPVPVSPEYLSQIQHWNEKDWSLTLSNGKVK